MWSSQTPALSLNSMLILRSFSKSIFHKRPLMPTALQRALTQTANRLEAPQSSNHTHDASLPTSHSASSTTVLALLHWRSHTYTKPRYMCVISTGHRILSTGWMVPSGAHASREVRHGAASVLSTGWARPNPAPSCQQDGVETRNYPVDRTYRESISLQILLDIRPTKGSSCQQDDSPNKAGSDITEFLPHSDAVILSTGRSVPIFPSSWQQDDFILSRHPVNRMNQLCPSLILTTGWRCNRPYVHYGWKPHSGDGSPPPRSRLRQHPQTPPRAGFGVSGTSDFEVLP